MMKRLISLFITVLLLFTLFGCTKTGTAGSEPTEQQLFTMLFDIHNKVSLRLDMSDEELTKMQADYETYSKKGSKSPIYRIADLHISITTPENTSYTYTVKEVGVRMKGNTSRTDFYSKEEGIYNLIHLKLSFQETFDDEQYYGSEAKIWSASARKERKSRTFATLEKIDLRWNRCDDSTYLKEYFAYATYRQYGVLAPHTNLCSFEWSGLHMGVFTINEPIDDIFLAKNLPQEALGGDLYKIGWGGSGNGSFTSTDSIGIEDEDAGKFYAYDLKTNKKTSTHEDLTNLIKNLGSDITKESFAQLVDIDNFLSYCAVSYLLGNPDDLRNNYNNSYIYFRADNGKAMIIPYDFDRCLGITAHWNPTGDGVTSDNPFSLTLNADHSNQKNPLFLYSVTAGGYYVREYAAKLEKIASDDWFTNENFASLYRIAEKNYADLAAPVRQFHNTMGLYMTFNLELTSDFASNGNISFREYREAKLITLKIHLSNIDQYISGSPQIPLRWYIRNDATDWQMDNAYTMTQENNLIQIRLTVENQMRLKVYDDQTGRWYGAECVSEECSVSFETDTHTNIILETGTYHIYFDPESEAIMLEKE